jgi:hypothetical protein
MIMDGSSWRGASLVNATSETSETSRGVDDEADEAPVLEPAYDDLLDEQWLQRGDALDPGDDLVDIGLTIDMTDSEDLEDAQATELDVGSLLTSLPVVEPVDGGEAGERDGSEAALGALQELLLPEESSGRRDENEEIGDDERFPAFDGLSAPRHPEPLDDDAEGPREG